MENAFVLTGQTREVIPLILLSCQKLIRHNNFFFSSYPNNNS